MKRWLVKLVVFLLLGAIVNVAMAWVLILVVPSMARARIAALTDIYPTSYNIYIEGRFDFYAEHPFRFAVPPDGELLCDPIAFGVCYERTFDASKQLPNQDVPSGVWCRLSAGAPMIGCTSRWRTRNDFVDFARKPVGNTAVFVPFPIWPGFAVNTIFYAGVLWMVFAFPFTFRRRRRIKRGLCPACAYPLGTSPVCTECGNRLWPRHVGLNT